jgi:hypothetical protein
MTQSFTSAARPKALLRGAQMAQKQERFAEAHQHE